MNFPSAPETRNDLFAALIDYVSPTPQKARALSLKTDGTFEISVVSIYAKELTPEKYLEWPEMVWAWAPWTSLPPVINHEAITVVGEEQAPTVYARWLFINLTLAGIYHDLIVAGDQVIVERGKPATGTSQPPQQPKVDGRRKTPTPVLNLPRRCSIYIQGNREWSDGEDRKRIQRNRRLVRRLLGFPRRLHEGWKRSQAIQEFLDDHGIPLPDTHTFVRPVTALATAEDVEVKPAIARSRALQAIALTLPGATT